jgi:hypothetical protein
MLKSKAARIKIKGKKSSKDEISSAYLQGR